MLVVSEFKRIDSLKSSEKLWLSGDFWVIRRDIILLNSLIILRNNLETSFQNLELSAFRLSESFSTWRKCEYAYFSCYFVLLKKIFKDLIEILTDNGLVSSRVILTLLGEGFCLASIITPEIPYQKILITSTSLVSHNFLLG